MSHPYIVYRITSPTQRVYIGVTKNRKERMSRYAGGRCQSQPLIYRSILKHGWDNHTVEVLIKDIPTQDEAFQHERRLIAIYKAQGISLNVAPGGEAGPCYSGKDHYHSKAIVQFDLDRTFMRVWDSATLAAAFVHCNPLNISQACRQGYHRSHGFYWMLKTDYDAGKRPQVSRKWWKTSKPVVQLTLDGEYIATHRTCCAGAQAVGTGYPNIAKCLAGIRTQAGGFHWVWAEAYEQGVHRIRNHKRPPRLVNEVDQDGNVLRRFRSLAEAGRATGLSPQGIAAICDGRTKVPRHHRFAYAPPNG